VLRVKPGITDYASIEFRNEEEILIKSPNPQKTYIEEILPQKLHLYEKYEKEHNCMSDYKIIIKTLYVIIFK
ncbi:MAG: sugar transferase, partial [Bacteroidota bacterium]|nr:sugar transferase [Bacteroidota bacterium]